MTENTEESENSDDFESSESDEEISKRRNPPSSSNYEESSEEEKPKRGRPRRTITKKERRPIRPIRMVDSESESENESEPESENNSESEVSDRMDEKELKKHIQVLGKSTRQKSRIFDDLKFLPKTEVILKLRELNPSGNFGSIGSRPKRNIRPPKRFHSNDDDEEEDGEEEEEIEFKENRKPKRKRSANHRSLDLGTL